MTGPGWRDDPPGLQAERTELAWTRTALSAIALGALATHLADDTALRTAMLGAVAAVALVAVGAAVVRVRALRIDPRMTRPPSRAFALLTVAVVLSDIVVLFLLIA